MALDGLCQVEVDQGITTQHHEGVVKEGLKILDFFETTRRTQGVSDQFAVLNTALEAVSNFNTEALAIIRQGAETLRTTPRADMPGFIPCEQDQKRTQRYEQLRRVEASFREALREDRKRYDNDMNTIATKEKPHER